MTIVYLLIEFLDELVFGVSETAWPFIRDDLAALSSFVHHMAKVNTVALMGLFVVGCYAILKAHRFSSMQEQSGVAQALGSIRRIVGTLIPLGIGLVAQACGLQTAMWLLLASPIALFLGLPRQGNQSPVSNL